MTNESTVSKPVTDIVTIRQAAYRAQQEQLAISEYTLRRWIKEGRIPVRRAGTRVLLYYPNLVKYLCCNRPN